MIKKVLCVKEVKKRFHLQEIIVYPPIEFELNYK